MILDDAAQLRQSEWIARTVAELEAASPEQAGDVLRNAVQVFTNQVLFYHGYRAASEAVTRGTEEVKLALDCLRERFPDIWPLAQIPSEE